MSIVVQHRRDSTTNVEANTPAAAELWMDTTKKELSLGDGAVSGGIRLSKKNIREILAPAQLVANTNDYSPAGLKHAGALRLSTDASRNLTGVVPLTVTDATDGRQLTLYNAGSFNLVVQDQNAASSAANRFDLGGADITLAPKQSLSLRYSTAISRWELTEGTFGQAIADNVVSARKLATTALGAGAVMINGTVVTSFGGGALNINIKTLAGGDPSPTDPVYVAFRNATAATGDYSILTLTAATAMPISNGSSVGASSGVAFKLWVAGFNDAGTFRLGVVNAVSGVDVMPLGGFGIASSTAEGGAGAADSAQVFYTGAAVAAKPYTLLAYLAFETGLAGAGGWVVNPTRIQLFGPGVPLPGATVNFASAITGASATGTTIIPFDDTIPQNTEGDQYLSKAITPSSAAHLLEIEAQVAVTYSIAADIIAALFQDTTASALAVQDINLLGTTPAFIRLGTVVLAGLSVSTTFKIRAGGHTAGTTTFNGTSGARKFGGAYSSFLRIREIAT